VDSESEDDGREDISWPPGDEVVLGRMKDESVLEDGGVVVMVLLIGALLPNYGM
jgi:hypothetical protein